MCGRDALCFYSLHLVLITVVLACSVCVASVFCGVAVRVLFLTGTLFGKMTFMPNGSNLRTASELRSLAELRLRDKLKSAPSVTSGQAEMMRLVYELEVRQVELEIQQEELTRGRAELEESLGMYTELYDFAPAGYLTLDRNSTILRANLTASCLLGFDRSRLLGMLFKEFVVPEDYRVLEGLLDKVFIERVPGICEVKLLADAGNRSKTGCVLIVRLDAGFCETGCACRVIITDVTERKMAEDEMRRVSRALLATNSCNLALIKASDELELVQKICNIVVDIGGYRMAWIGFAEHDKAKSVRVIAQSGFEEGYLETIRIVWDDIPFGRGPTGTAIRTGEPAASLDIAHDLKMLPWRKEAVKHGLASSLGLPLKAGKEVFGALSIYSSHSGAFNAEETGLLAALADEVAYGIMMLRTREAKMRSDDELRRSEERDIAAKMVAEKKIMGYVKLLENAMQSALHAVAKVVEAHDPYTAGHEFRVGLIAADIAREMGWGEEECNTLNLIGLVHDIGKMSIPSEILSKPGVLSAIEFQLVKTHAEHGYEILKDVEFPLPIAEIIREHHERMDGSGYPRGLKGEGIRLEARILAVADVLEAMASHRPYRASLGIDAAISEIETHRGDQFDPDVVDALLRLFREKSYQLPAAFG